ncbi:class I adenylate-forming enzyme family protein, partial [Neobacillus niacini]|uniref:class I adenylate-forming enzyme family protein n=1 Tax=Neobacillus niacini TaxID=86668 RepID=UPI002FFDDF46
MLHTYAESTPFQERVLTQLLDFCAEKRGSSPFFLDLIEGKQEISYQTMKQRVDIIASHLLKIGVRKGSHVGILMPTCRDNLFLWFALAKIGAVEIPINTIYKGDTLLYLINDSDAEFLFLNEEF